MPKTRSQAGKEDEGRREEARTFQDPPASPSTMAPPTTEGEGEQSSAQPITTRTEQEVREPGTRPASVCSRSSSVAARVKRAELQAEERLAEIRRKELNLEAELIKKRLAWEIATIMETDEESVPVEDTQGRVADWMERSTGPRRRVLTEGTHLDLSQEIEKTEMTRRRQEARANELDKGRHITDSPYHTPNNGQKEAEMAGATADREPTKVMTEDSGMMKLAGVLEKMVLKRPVPRQAQELPSFSGAPAEWLPFKAAMRDSTEVCRFTRAENLARLRASLKGDAKEAVSALLYTATDPGVIMSTLEQCFGRPEVIIDRALSDIRSLPRPGNTASDLNTFAIKLQNIVCILDNIDNRGYLRNPMLTREIVEKLGPHLRSRWCDYAEENGTYSEPEVVTLSRFMMKEADKALRHAYSYDRRELRKEAFECVPRNRTFTKTRQDKRRAVAVYNTTGVVKNHTEQEIRRCFCCGGDHDVPQCKKFKNMSLPKRWEYLRNDRICFRCLKYRHKRMYCQAKLCGIDGCRYPHHALLHEDRSKQQQQQPPKDNTETVASVNHSADASEVLLKVCPVHIEGPRGVVKTYALLDEGSTITVIDRALAREIGADGPVKELKINSVSAQTTVTDSRTVTLRIKPKKGNKRYIITARTIPDLQLSKQTSDIKCKEYAHLRGLKENDVCHKEARPRVLIGADNWHLIVTRKLLTGKRHEPVASLTKLGWIIHGAAPRSKGLNKGESVMYVNTPTATCSDIMHTHPRDEELNKLVREHFEIDSLGIGKKERVNPEDEYAIELFEKTSRLRKGRYEVRLPWKRDDVTMPPSYEAAMKRLRSLELRMDKSENFKSQYNAQIKNLFEKGYAEKATEDDMESPKQWYLPHFAVTNVNKPGKLRLVFDAAARSNGVCLNDELLEGPDKLRDLAGLLLRFRERPVAVTADIREMFLRIKICAADQPAQMFLWRGDDRKKPPVQYKMTSMIFGAKCSPFLAHSVRDKNAYVNREEYPLAYDAITRSHYMDDYVDCYEKEKDAREALHQVIKVHSKAGFTLAGVNSNMSSVISELPPEDRATSLKLLGANSEGRDKTLGLLWNAGTDELSFNTNMVRVPDDVKTCKRTATKREALSAVMSVFDPLGLLSYFTIRAKIMLQKIWRLKVEWDDPLTEEEAIDFQDWLGDMNKLRHLRIQRVYLKTGGASASKELHCFCDASNVAFATAVYWRTQSDDGGVRVALVAAKARVAPIKTQSVPRLELQAALIGARLTATVVREHRWQAERIVYWTDSLTVIKWLKNDRVRYDPYVAHRLGELAEITEVAQWRWVPTHLNVADDATRDFKETKDSQDRWFVGPEFLYEDEKEWPTCDVTDDAIEAVYHTGIDTAAYTRIIDVKRFSSYERLIRTMGRVLYFVDRCRHRADEMNLRHINDAERRLIIESQRDSFGEDIDRLKNGTNLRRGSRVWKFDPYVDEDGVLRARGRIRAAGVSAPATTPVILDGSHPYARLLLEREHRRAHHSHNERVVNDVRQNICMLRLRPAVRTVAYKCALCRLRRARPRTPVIGDLPRARIEPYTRPFTNCGVDYFGPITVTVGRRHEKRWGALFTCLTTRAIHIELVTSLSTDSAIMAFRRMAARRGWPAVVYSDNATNFRGADQELRRAVEEWEPALKDVALTHRIDWRYISPGAPHQGGAWERMIQSVKRALQVTLNEKHPREEVLATLLAEVEYTMNARPLTHVPVDEGAPEALTPNHFLLGSSGGLPITGPCEQQQATKKTWRTAQALADEYWRRWLREYLPELVPRGGARSAGERAIKEGDLVVVVDSSLPRNVWPRGVVTRTFPGPDGETRNVEIRTRGGVFRRPTTRLAVLPVEEEVAQGDTGGRLLRTDLPEEVQDV